MSTQASAFHRIVVEDVIKGIREDFINEGVDEQVLEELKQLWESKLVHAGVYDYPAQVSNNYAYDMNNYNYLDTSHAQPAGLLPTMAPQTSLFNMNTYLGSQTTAARGGNTAAHHAALSALRQLNPTPATLTSTTTSTANYAYDATGKPQPFLAAPPGVSGGWNTQPSVPQGLNTQFNPANIKQNDGANDEKDSERLKKKEKEEDDDDDDDEDGSTKGDEELGSDLDDEDDDEEPDTEHIVLCQYEKVTRVKNKRKANLKDGIMHINGKDYVFSKATGEFDW